MTPPSRSAGAYGWLLRLLRGRDVQEQRAIEQDAGRLLDAARMQGRGAVATTRLALLCDLVFNVGHDLARALRSLLRSPGFAVTVSLLLGLGVAATTTLFALVNAVLLTPLPYADPERLVMVWESNVPLKRLREGPSPGNLSDWIAQNDTFESLTATASSSVARSIVTESLMLPLGGCLAGAAGVTAVSQLARSILFGIAPHDPLTLAVTAAVLVGVVLAASWLPARRAASIDPVSAMRI